jgi:hypothetical protein
MSTLVVTSVASASDWWDADKASLQECMGDKFPSNWSAGSDLLRGEAAAYMVWGSYLCDLTEEEQEAALSQAAEGDYFSDLGSHTYAAEVNLGYELGWWIGYSDADGEPTGKFGPNDKLTREQYMKMVVEANGWEFIDAELPHPDANKVSDWAVDYVTTAYVYGVFTGQDDMYVAPGEGLQRSEGVVMAVQAQGASPIASRMDSEEEDDDDDAVTGGDLVLSLGDVIDGATLPKNATSVKMMNIEVKAGSSAAELDGLTLTRYGVSSLPSSHSVYLYEGSNRLTSGKSINSSTNQAVFSNLNLVFSKNETKVLTVRMDVGAVTETGELGFELASEDDVDANDGDVSLDGSVKGEKFGLSTTAAGTLTVTKNGTITNPKVGEDDVTIAKFKLDAATEVASIEEIGLLVEGTVSNDAVENLELYVAGEDDPIATVDGLNSNDIAAFVLDTPYELGKGETKAFTVKGDFNTGRSGDTVKVYVDQTTDILSIGGTYGYGMAIDIATSGTYDGTSCTSSAGNCSYSALEGGDITISSSGPVATSVAVGGKDVVLMDLSIISVSDVTFKNFPVALTASESADTTEGLLNDTAANFTDIKITDVDSGKTLMGPIDATSLTTALAGATAITEAAGDNAIAYYLFSDEFDMEAGEELNLQLTADVANTATLDAMTVYGTINLGNASNTYPQIKDVNNKTITNTTSLVPTSDITGKTMTLASPSLTASLAAVPVSGSNTKVKGQKDVDFTGISLLCGTASDCKVTDVTLTGSIDDNGNASAFAAGVGADHSTYLNAYVGSVKLVDGDGNPVASAQSVQSTGSVVFSNLSYEIEAGDTVVVYVRGDISSNAYANSNAENIAFSLASAGISFDDNDGNTKSSTGAVNATPTTYVTTSQGGTLTIAIDAATPNEDILVAGTSDNEITKIKFTSVDEAFLVKSLSINARQSATTDATTLGDYDNNVSSVKISYTNSEGETETKTGYLTSGTAQFSGLDMYIDKDDDAVLTVSANLNTISGGAQAGEFVDFNVAVNNLEAISQSSGIVYNGSKLDQDEGLLSLGTLTWVDSGYNTNNEGETVSSLGSTQTLTIDIGTRYFPIGTLLYVDDVVDAAYDNTAESLFVVTSAWSTTVPTVRVLGNDDAAIAQNKNVYYALPGTGYLTASKQMHVYQAKPTFTLSSSSPAATNRSVSATDDAFVFELRETGGQDKIQIRAGVEGTIGDGYDSAGGNNLAPAAVTTTGLQVDGSSVSNLLTNFLPTDSISIDMTTDVANHARVAFWFSWTDAEAVGSPAFKDFNYNVTSSATEDPEAGQIDLTQTLCGADAADMVNGEWYFCDVPISTINAGADDRYFHLIIEDMTELLVADTLRLDRVIAYNDKLTVDISTDDDLDSYANNTSNAGGPVEAYLKEGGSTLATGYWTTVNNGATGADATTGSVTFIPTTEISISKGSMKTLKVQTDTSDLLHEDAGTDDPVTFSIGLGSATNGTVTAGDFWWNDTNFSNATAGSAPGSSYAAATPGIIKWIGEVSNATFNSNTVKY